MSLVTPGAHGGDAWRLAEALEVPLDHVLDLSASLNPVAPPVAALAAAHLDELTRYPSDHRATTTLAEAMGVDPGRLVLTNGGAEAIALVARMMPVGWVERPDFSLYARHLDRLEPGAPVWRSDPHNPTGRLASPDEVADVRDEAFFPLATGRWTRGDDSVVVGSLTKLFACPGLRLGYVLAPDERIATAIRSLRPEWSVNGLAAAMLPELLSAADLPGWSTAIVALRRELADVLARHGYRAEPGAANYLWIPAATGLRERLLPTGILIRSGASFGAPDAARIAVPTPDGLARLADALEQTHP